MDLTKVEQAEQLLRDRSKLQQSLKIFNKEQDEAYMVIGNLHIDHHFYGKGIIEECKAVVEKHLKKTLEEVEAEIEKL